MTTENKENKPKITEADLIWDEIKDKEVQIYALPNQLLSNHVTKLPIPGACLYLRTNSPAIQSMLETVIGDKYEVHVTEKGYLQISRKPPILDLGDETVSFQRNGKIETIDKAKYLGK